MKFRPLAILLMVTSMLALPSLGADEVPWQRILADRLPLYGHRKWIVIADSAYPSQSSDAIETVVTNAPQIEVLKAVLAALADTKHVKPNVFTDAELKYVPEQDAPGITQFRSELGQLLTGHDVSVISHDQAIAKVDEASRTFHVLILKTDSVIPYTTVFLQLQCAYWNADAEKRLRDAMAAEGK